MCTLVYLCVCVCECPVCVREMERKIRLSLSYCITEVWDNVCILLGLSKLAAELSHGSVS